ncbi:MAG: glycosyltransferase family 9 protein [Bilophila wadsworthia]
MKRIAVWNTAFLGDAVLTLPLIQTLADAFPGSEIDFCAPGLASLFEAHPALHAVYGTTSASPGTIACPRCSERAYPWRAAL